MRNLHWKCANTRKKQKKDGKRDRERERENEKEVEQEIEKEKKISRENGKGRDRSSYYRLLVGSIAIHITVILEEKSTGIWWFKQIWDYNA